MGLGEATDHKGDIEIDGWPWLQVTWFEMQPGRNLVLKRHQKQSSEASPNSLDVRHFGTNEFSFSPEPS